MKHFIAINFSALPGPKSDILLSLASLNTPLISFHKPPRLRPNKNVLKQMGKCVLTHMPPVKTHLPPAHPSQQTDG